MWHWTLRQKIVAFVLILMAAFLVAREVARASQSYDVYLDFVVEEAESTAQTLAVAIAQDDYWSQPARMQDLLLTLQAQFSRLADGDTLGRDTREILVVDRNSQVIAATDLAWVGTTLSAEAQRALSRVINQGVVASYRARNSSGAASHLAVPIEIDGQRRGALIVQYFQDPARTLTRANVIYEFLTITVLTMGLVLILLVGIRKMVLQPLAVLQAGARRLSEGDLDARIELKTGDELETVAQAFNCMAGALKAYQAQRVAQEKQAALVEMASVTADELSEPLTVIMGYAELLREQRTPDPEFLDKALQSIRRGSQQMAQIVRQLSNMSTDCVARSYSDYELNCTEMACIAR